MLRSKKAGLRVGEARVERLSRLNVAEFQRFCDAIGSKAAKAGLTEEKLAELLASDA